MTLEIKDNEIIKVKLIDYNFHVEGYFYRENNKLYYFSETVNSTSFTGNGNTDMHDKAFNYVKNIHPEIVYTSFISTGCRDNFFDTCSIPNYIIFNRYSTISKDPEYAECVNELSECYGKKGYVYKVKNWMFGTLDCLLEGSTSGSTDRNRFKPSTKEVYDKQQNIKNIPEYIEALHSDNGDSNGGFRKGIIYKVNLEESTITHYRVIKDSLKRDNGWSCNYFKPSTKEIYEAQTYKELLSSKVTDKNDIPDKPFDSSKYIKDYVNNKNKEYFDSYTKQMSSYTMEYSKIHSYPPEKNSDYPNPIILTRKTKTNKLITTKQ